MPYNLPPLCRLLDQWENARSGALIASSQPPLPSKACRCCGKNSKFGGRSSHCTCRRTVDWVRAVTGGRPKHRYRGCAARELGNWADSNTSRFPSPGLGCRISCCYPHSQSLLGTNQISHPRTDTDIGQQSRTRCPAIGNRHSARVGTNLADSPELTRCPAIGNRRSRPQSDDCPNQYA